MTFMNPTCNSSASHVYTSRNLRFSTTNNLPQLVKRSKAYHKKKTGTALASSLVISVLTNAPGSKVQTESDYGTMFVGHKPPTLGGVLAWGDASQAHYNGCLRFFNTRGTELDTIKKSNAALVWAEDLKEHPSTGLLHDSCVRIGTSRDGRGKTYLSMFLSRKVDLTRTIKPYFRVRHWGGT